MGSSASLSHSELNNFSPCIKIGEDSYSDVYRGTYAPNKSQYSLKVFNIEDCVSRTGGTDALHAEISSLKRLSYNNFICNLNWAFRDTTNCVLVLDLFDGGDLNYHLRDGVEFTEQDVAFIIACTASALNHIHYHGVIHRDVTLSNIVLDGQGYPRLTNFSLSHIATSTMVCTASTGTAGYIAPEVLTSTHCHSTESDFWNLGVVMYALLFGEMPFSCNCPTHFVTFVEETYRDLWELDQYKTSYSFSSNETCVDEFSISTRTLSEGVADIFRSSASVSLPISMMVRLPSLTRCGERVSSAFVSALRGLMDVRIPQRLGAGPNFGALQRHPFFRVLDWHKLLTKKIVSPLQVDVNITRSCLEEKYSMDCISKRDPVNTSTLPSPMRQILSEYSYISPECGVKKLLL